MRQPPARQREAATFCIVLLGKPAATIFAVAAFTGARRGEIHQAGHIVEFIASNFLQIARNLLMVHPGAQCLEYQGWSNTFITSSP